MGKKKNLKKKRSKTKRRKKGEKNSPAESRTPDLLHAQNSPSLLRRLASY